MDEYEDLLSRYTSLNNREVLGAIGLVVDDKGSVLYHKADGRQSLSDNAPALDRDAVFELGSAGKLFTHIAALQCVERGLIELDDPVGAHLPELGALQVLSQQREPSEEGQSAFVLEEPTTPVTLRHLLTHTSGVGDPFAPIYEELMKENRTSQSEISNPANVLLKPLLFNPGEAWLYGASIAWTSKLITALTGQKLPDYIQTNVFDPLGMVSSTFHELGESSIRPDLRDRRLQFIIRQAGSEGSRTKLIVPKRLPPMLPATTASDYGTLLVALMSPSSGKRILKQESIDLLFSGQLSGKPLQDFRADTETYAAPTGLPSDFKDSKVNFTVAGALLAEERCPLSSFPPGTLTWNGAPNVIWAVNRERKKAAIFATQSSPVDDPIAVELAMAFFKGVWKA